MYSIIDSCHETSGWHLVGLRSVKEIALSSAGQMSPREDREYLATMSPAGLNVLRCHKAILHTMDCTTERCQDREGFFLLSGMWLAPLSQRSITFRWLCVSPERDSDTHEASAAQRGFSAQRSTAGRSLRPAKRNYLLEHGQVLVPFLRDECCVWPIFVATNIPSSALDVWHAVF